MITGRVYSICSWDTDSYDNTASSVPAQHVGQSSHNQAIQTSLTKHISILWTTYYFWHLNMRKVKWAWMIYYKVVATCCCYKKGQGKDTFTRWSWDLQVLFITLPQLYLPLRLYGTTKVSDHTKIWFHNLWEILQRLSTLSH